MYASGQHSVELEVTLQATLQATFPEMSNNVLCCRANGCMVH